MEAKQICKRVGNRTFEYTNRPYVCLLYTSQEQIEDGRFAASRTSDDRCGFSRLGGKRDAVKRILRSVGITEGYIFKRDSSRRIFQLGVAHVFNILYMYFGIKDFVDSGSRHAGAGQHDGDHRQHEEGHDDQHRVGDELSLIHI